MLNERDLKIFIELCQTKNISRAAERIGLTQPALTIWIKKIEEQIGSALFLRSKKGLTLTLAGRKLEQKSKEMLGIWENFINEIKNDDENLKGVFKLGIHSGVAIYSLPPIYKALQKNSPETELQLYHDLSRHLTEEVISNKLDLALVMNPIKHPDLVIIPLIKDQMNIWYNPNYIETRTLIYNPDLIQSQWILKKIKGTKLKFDHYIQTSSFEVAISLAKNGVGACIAPQQICKQLAPTQLAPITSNTLRYTDELCLIFKSGFNRSKVTENLVSQIKTALLSIK